MLARRWLGLAVGSLVLAGVLAVLLVAGRLPGVDALLGDGTLFKRFLVIHVDLSLVVWFVAFELSLISMLPARRDDGLLAAIARSGVTIALIGVAALVAVGGIRNAQPVLANYVPSIDHPLFTFALVVFFVGAALTAGAKLVALDAPAVAPLAATSLLTQSARPFVMSSAVALVLACLTFVASWLSVRDTQLVAPVLQETTVWAGGHVLQFASVAAMLATWIALVERATQREVVKPGAALLLAVALTLPLFAAPIVALDAANPFGASRSFFTSLMQFGIFPVALVVLGLSVRTLAQAYREGELARGDVRVWGFAVSAGMTLVGFTLGALIRGSSTMIPGHYHASIGAVTAAFMTLTYPLLAELGASSPTETSPRLVRWQPVLFGVGQTIFAVGFALAGAQGMARKTYGAENAAARSSGGSFGLAVMGLGGLIAVVGGLLFMWMVVRALRAHRGTEKATSRRTESWVATGATRAPSKH